MVVFRFYTSRPRWFRIHVENAYQKCGWFKLLVQSLQDALCKAASRRSKMGLIRPHEMLNQMFFHRDRRRRLLPVIGFRSGAVAIEFPETLESLNLEALNS